MNRGKKSSRGFTAFDWNFDINTRWVTLWWILDVSIEGAGNVYEAYNATWILRTNSAFVLGPRKTMESLHLAGRSQGPPDAYRLLASSPAFKYMNHNVSTYLRRCLIFWTIQICFTKVWQSYFTAKTQRLHYKDQPVRLFSAIIAICARIVRNTYVNTLCM
jgi:hypothetical protein